MKYESYETNRTEFKLTLDKSKKFSWLKKVCGLANEFFGGMLVVGVSDNGDIVGVENTSAVIDLFVSEVKNCITPHVDFSIDIKQFGKKEVVIITISQGKQTPYILKENSGRHIVYVMRGNTTEPANQNDLLQLALRASNLSWDSLESSYTADQLTFNTFADRHKKVFGADLTRKDLEELELIKNNFITNMGVLFSDQNPNADSWISVTRWPGLDKTASAGIIDHQFKGSIITQIEAAYELILEIIHVEFSFSEDSPQRKSSYEYDRRALREVIINAIAHRDYSIHNNQQIEVGIYDDRIEVKSTGSLLNGHTVEDLINLRTIGRRNAILCNVLRELEYIESRGRGMSKIINPKEPWKKEPTFESSYNFFMVTLYSQLYKTTSTENEDTIGTLDHIDMQILRLLKNNPTISQRDIATELRLSRRNLTNRFSKMYGLNIIKKEGFTYQTKYIVLVDID